MSEAVDYVEHDLPEGGSNPRSRSPGACIAQDCRSFWHLDLFEAERGVLGEGGWRASLLFFGQGVEV